MTVPHANNPAARASLDMPSDEPRNRIKTAVEPTALLTAQRVAELLGVSPEYVWQMSREGRIPTIRLGRTRRYRLDSILDWLEEIELRGGPGR
jgi:excisionase family DNA binding protein